MKKVSIMIAVVLLAACNGAGNKDIRTTADSASDKMRADSPGINRNNNMHDTVNPNGIRPDTTMRQ